MELAGIKGLKGGLCESHTGCAQADFGACVTLECRVSAGATGKSQVRSDGETGRFTEVIVQAGKA